MSKNIPKFCQIIIEQSSMNQKSLIFYKTESEDVGCDGDSDAKMHYTNSAFGTRDDVDREFALSSVSKSVGLRIYVEIPRSAAM